MIKFDMVINNLITSHGGIYRRYSDDIFIAISNIQEGKQICNQIEDIVSSIPNLKLSENKTKYFVKLNDCMAELVRPKTINNLIKCDEYSGVYHNVNYDWA